MRENTSWRWTSAPPAFGFLMSCQLRIRMRTVGATDSRWGADDRPSVHCRIRAGRSISSVLTATKTVGYGEQSCFDSEFWLPSSDFWLPASDFSPLTSKVSLLPADFQLPPSDLRLPPHFFPPFLSRLRSASTIIFTSSSKDTFGFQPRFLWALLASPSS